MTSIWNIEEANPRPVQEQPNSDIYVFNTDRTLPDLTAGFRVQDGTERFTYPNPSFLYSDDGIRGDLFGSVSAEQQDFWIDKRIRTDGQVPKVDCPSLRSVLTTEDGVPIQQVVRDPGAVASNNPNDPYFKQHYAYHVPPGFENKNPPNVNGQGGQGGGQIIQNFNFHGEKESKQPASVVGLSEQEFDAMFQRYGNQLISQIGQMFQARDANSNAELKQQSQDFNAELKQQSQDLEERFFKHQKKSKDIITEEIKNAMEIERRNYETILRELFQIGENIRLLNPGRLLDQRLAAITRLTGDIAAHLEEFNMAIQAEQNNVGVVADILHHFQNATSANLTLGEKMSDVMDEVKKSIDDLKKQGKSSFESKESEEERNRLLEALELAYRNLNSLDENLTEDIRAQINILDQTTIPETQRELQEINVREDTFQLELARQYLQGLINQDSARAFQSILDEEKKENDYIQYGFHTDEEKARQLKQVKDRYLIRKLAALFDSFNDKNAGAFRLAKQRTQGYLEQAIVQLKIAEPTRQLGNALQTPPFSDNAEALGNTENVKRQVKILRDIIQYLEPLRQTQLAPILQVLDRATTGFENRDQTATDQYYQVYNELIQNTRMFTEVLAREQNMSRIQRLQLDFLLRDIHGLSQRLAMSQRYTGILLERVFQLNGEQDRMLRRIEETKEQQFITNTETVGSRLEFSNEYLTIVDIFNRIYDPNHAGDPEYVFTETEPLMANYVSLMARLQNELDLASIEGNNVTGLPRQLFTLQNATFKLLEKIRDVALNLPRGEYRDRRLRNNRLTAQVIRFAMTFMIRKYRDAIKNREDAIPTSVQDYLLVQQLYLESQDYSAQLRLDVDEIAFTEDEIRSARAPGPYQDFFGRFFDEYREQMGRPVPIVQVLDGANAGVQAGAHMIGNVVNNQAVALIEVARNEILEIKDGREFKDGENQENGIIISDNDGENPENGIIISDDDRENRENGIIIPDVEMKGNAPQDEEKNLQAGNLNQRGRRRQRNVNQRQQRVPRNANQRQQRIPPNQLLVRPNNTLPGLQVPRDPYQPPNYIPQNLPVLEGGAQNGGAQGNQDEVQVPAPPVYGGPNPDVV